MNALIGWSGFVGSTLMGQAPAFDQSFRSTNIRAIADQGYELVVCAGAPGAKWLANREPERDRESLSRLMDALRGVRTQRFVLISTVDVFGLPREVNEDSPVNEGACPYGQHRRDLERFVCDSFTDPLIVRLPALVGPGLRKNSLFDLLNRNAVDRLDGAAEFQFYPTRRLWADIQIALDASLRLVHLVAPPRRLGDIAKQAFAITLAERGGSASPRYDVRSRHAAAFGGLGPWIVSRDESFATIQDYARQEPRVRP